MEAMRCLKRRISDAVYRQLLDAQTVTLTTATQEATSDLSTGPGGHCGASQESSAVDLSRSSTLRISHFPDPPSRRYNRHPGAGRPRPNNASESPVDNIGGAEMTQ